MPVSTNVQAAGNPGAEAEPVAVIGIVVPPSCPVAVPDTARLPAHSAVKVPEITVALWLVTFHCRLPQVDIDGTVVSVCDAHVPTNEDGDEVAAPPPVDAAVVGAVGPSGLVVVDSNPHAAARSETATTVISREIILFFMVTLPSNYNFGRTRTIL